MLITLQGGPGHGHNNEAPSEDQKELFFPVTKDDETTWHKYVQTMAVTGCCDRRIYRWQGIHPDPRKEVDHDRR